MFLSAENMKLGKVEFGFENFGRFGHGLTFCCKWSAPDGRSYVNTIRDGDWNDAFNLYSKFDRKLHPADFVDLLIQHFPDVQWKQLVNGSILQILLTDPEIDLDISGDDVTSRAVRFGLKVKALTSSMTYEETHAWLSILFKDLPFDDVPMFAVACIFLDIGSVVARIKEVQEFMERNTDDIAIMINANFDALFQTLPKTQQLYMKMKYAGSFEH